MNRKSRDRKIAQEIAAELCEELGPALPPEALTANRDTVCEVFGRVLDRHQIVSENAAAHILACMGKVLAKNFVECNRQLDAARRLGK